MFTIRAAKVGRLIKGKWHKRTWIGFVTLSRMIRAYLDYSVKHGVHNFDVVIMKCLIVLMIASLGCRSGDAGRSRGYTGCEYLQYQHIRLELEIKPTQKPQFKELHAEISLE